MIEGIWAALASATTAFYAWARTEQAIGGLITASAALLVFVVSQWIGFVIRRYDRAIVRRRLVVGLHAEIGSNLKEIREFVDREAYFEAVRAKIREEGEQGRVFRPAIVITESSRFFSANAGLIPELRVAALVPLMEFYRLIEELDDRRGAFESKAYETISPDGRAGLVDDLWMTGTKAKLTGEHTLAVLQAEYPSTWFRALAQAEARMPPTPSGPASAGGSNPDGDRHETPPPR